MLQTVNAQLPTLPEPQPPAPIAPAMPTIPPQPSTVKGFYTYTNSTHHFKIDYPQNWTSEQPDNPEEGQIAQFVIHSGDSINTWFEC